MHEILKKFMMLLKSSFDKSRVRTEALKKFSKDLFNLSTMLPAGNFGMAVNLGVFMTRNRNGRAPAEINLSLSEIRHAGPKIGKRVE